MESGDAGPGSWGRDRVQPGEELERDGITPTPGWFRDHSDRLLAAWAQGDDVEVSRLLHYAHAVLTKAPMGGEVFRTGRHNGQLIYRQLGEDPAKGDSFELVVIQPDRAQWYIDVLNAGVRASRS